MEWVQFVIFFIGVFGLFIWNRAEARDDARHMDTKLEAQRSLVMAIHQENRQNNQESRQYIETIRQEGRQSIEAIQQEMKDFHNRLCEIQERRSKNP